MDLRINRATTKKCLQLRERVCSKLSELPTFFLGVGCLKAICFASGLGCFPIPWLKAIYFFPWPWLISPAGISCLKPKQGEGWVKELRKNFRVASWSLSVFPRLIILPHWDSGFYGTLVSIWVQPVVGTLRSRWYFLGPETLSTPL